MREDSQLQADRKLGILGEEDRQFLRLADRRARIRLGLLAPDVEHIREVLQRRFPASRTFAGRGAR